MVRAGHSKFLPPLATQLLTHFVPIMAISGSIVSRLSNLLYRPPTSGMACSNLPLDRLMPPIIEMLNHGDMTDMMMPADCVRERENESSDRIPEIDFHWEEKLGLPLSRRGGSDQV